MGHRGALVRRWMVFDSRLLGGFTLGCGGRKQLRRGCSRCSSIDLSASPAFSDLRASAASVLQRLQVVHVQVRDLAELPLDPFLQGADAGLDLVLDRAFRLAFAPIHGSATNAAATMAMVRIGPTIRLTGLWTLCQF